MKMSERYILVNRKPVPEPDLMKWARWYEKANRVVLQESVGNKRVSTVFLGLDHQFGSGPPLLFETMVFGTEDEICIRYSTWNEAVKGHEHVVEMLEEEMMEKSENDK